MERHFIGSLTHTKNKLLKERFQRHELFAIENNFK